MSEQQLAAQIANVAVNYSIGEFLDGQRDCRDGVKHQDGKGESYDAGYRTEYELESIQSRGCN
jgi:hypothetical protein